MAMDQKYIDEASGVYDGQYASKKKGLENALNSNLNDLTNSKVGINSNYDTRVKGQNLQNTLGKNNFSNGMLGRGMGRSTIATSGLSGMDATNTRQVGDINNSRTSDLNNVDTSMANLRTGYTNNMIGLDGEKMGAVNQLAMQLRDKGVEENWKQKQFDFQQQQATADQTFRQQQAEADQSYKNSQLALQRESMYANANKTTTPKVATPKEAKDTPNDLYATYLNYQERGEGSNFIKDNRNDIISRYGIETYSTLANMDSEYNSSRTSNTPAPEEVKKNGFLKNFGQWLVPGGKKWGES